MLTSKEILAARRAGDRLARREGAASDEAVKALCRNACLLAAVGGGYVGGGGALAALSPEEILEKLDSRFFGAGGNPAFDDERFAQLARRGAGGAP